MADVAVSGRTKSIWRVSGHSGIALLEAGGIVDVVAEGVGEGVIHRADPRVFGLPRQTRLEGVVVGIGYVLKFRQCGVAEESQVDPTVGVGAVEHMIGGAEHHGVDVFE